MARGGGVLIAARVSSGLQLLAWHSVGDDGAVFVGLLSAPLPGGGGVALCCVCLFVWCWCTLRRVIYGYVFSPSYMTEHCSCYLKKNLPAENMRDGWRNIQKSDSYMRNISLS